MRVSNSLDPDKAWQNVGTDLGLNYMRWLSAGVTRSDREIDNSIPNTET